MRYPKRIRYLTNTHLSRFPELDSDFSLQIFLFRLFQFFHASSNSSQRQILGDEPPSREVETFGLHRNGQALQGWQLDTFEGQIAGQKLPQVAGQWELVQTPWADDGGGWSCEDPNRNGKNDVVNSSGIFHKWHRNHPRRRSKINTCQTCSNHQSEMY